VDRVYPHRAGDERTVLTGFLDSQRVTVRRKATGLRDDQAHLVLMPSSPLTTVAGLVRT
jgi:hypothetical protein